MRREGHYRIFLNEEAKNLEFQKTFADIRMPFKYLSQFKSEVIDPLLKTPNKGIGNMTKEIINRTGNNIRNIDELSFRILNLVLCSNLLVANILEVIDDNNMKQYFSEETSCFGIIIDNCNKIDELLKKNKINNFQIYMNVIFEKLIDMFNLYDEECLYNYKIRDNIEAEINSFIINENNQINEGIKLYEKINQEMLNSSPDIISSLIQELYPMHYYNDKNEYPYFKYFYYYNYPDSNNLFEIIESNNNYKNKYPLTYNILRYNSINNNEIEKLKYIPKINKKINHLINNYSYTISREQALNTKIKDEFSKKVDNKFIINNNKKNQKIDSYLKDLIDLFKSFKDVDLQWGCHKLAKMDLSINYSKMAEILLDDNEPGYYLSSIYKKLIEYQNIFLEYIINCNVQNGLLHCFVKQLNNEIMIQDANNNEILKLDIEGNINNNLKLYTNFDELIFINTIFDPHINNINYELDQIEIELGNIILPGVRKFKSSDDGALRYIIYQFEGYRGKNSNILTNFNEKYPPKELDNKEKTIFKEFIQNSDNDDYKSSLFSLQLLIDYIQKTEKKPNMSLSKIVRDIPDHINITEKIKLFFNNYPELTVVKLVRIFELFEYLCWEQIKENLLDEYMKKIDEEKKQSILKYLQENPDKNNYIKKNEYASAIRKFISRYLAGKRSQSEINEDRMLFDYLNRFDLWTKNIDNKEFEKEYFNIKQLKISVGEALDFYNILGEDSELLNLNVENNNSNNINNLNEEQINDNENNIIINDNDENREEMNNYEDDNNDDNDDYNMARIRKRRLF